MQSMNVGIVAATRSMRLSSLMPRTENHCFPAPGADPSAISRRS